MKCTYCSGTFDKVDFEDVIVMKCEGCGSFYVKESMFKELTSEPEKYANVIDDPNYEGYSKQNKEKKKCPECLKEMEQHHFSWDSDIIIDICQNCKSVWLDHGEIAKLANYIETHHEPLMEHIKHDLGKFAKSIKYLMYKIGKIFPYKPI